MCDTLLYVTVFQCILVAHFKLLVLMDYATSMMTSENFPRDQGLLHAMSD